MSVNPQREPGTARKSASYTADRLSAVSVSRTGPFSGSVEADEISMGGKRKNKRNAISEELTGGGPLAETAVVGAKDRDAADAAAQAVAATDTDPSQGFVRDRMDLRAAHCAEDASACNSPPFDPGPSGKPGRMGAFLGMRERGWVGIRPKTSPKHPQRYIREFEGRHDVRESDSADPMAGAPAGMTGRRVWSDDPIRNDDRASRAGDVVA